ncbi:putative lipase atg15 [Marasmius crinis-equi]|uniref:Lipase atg15 n=1 Tax=Marasmius crinis-equi TaxID=585013 RepID=A0ABR3EZN3_9AGAR
MDARIRSLRHAQSQSPAWSPAQVQGPNVTNRLVLQTLAKTSVSAYVQPSDKERWYPLGSDLSPLRLGTRCRRILGSRLDGGRVHQGNVLALHPRRAYDAEGQFVGFVSLCEGGADAVDGVWAL